MTTSAGAQGPPRPGVVYVVGIGPGSLDDVTARAREAIRRSDVVLGYKAYLDQIGPLISRKEVLSFPMGSENERAAIAVARASAGAHVALVSGGDPGIYGMAGPVYEALLGLPETGDGLPRVEVIPGITAASAAAALVGTPLMQDFAVLSLSDRFVPWEVIQKRLQAAMEGDFALVIYEPWSRRRPWQLRESRRLMLLHRPPDTPVAVVRNATRHAQNVALTTLGAMLDREIDMRTTLIIGNSQTVARRGLMLTPRFHRPERAPAPPVSQVVG